MRGPVCPLPIERYPAVTLGHGGGGRLTEELIRELFLAAFGDAAPGDLHDGALVDVEPGKLALSTDSFVIDPIFFPGGDIGSLAVHGTVNDVAMCGARPIALSTGFLLEEGLPMEQLWRVACSMGEAARAVGVPIVTGDTKVVERGKGDGVFVNTTGLGVLLPGARIDPRRARPGDAVLLSGPIADHGIAILSVREGLAFETELVSDSAPLAGLVRDLVELAGERIHVLRDPTRGGVASALNEIAGAAEVGITLDEAKIPLRDEVRGACEILGLDPLYVANEGKCIVIAEREAAEGLLERMRAHPVSREAALVGEITAEHPGRVWMNSKIGGRRVVDTISGEQLPRIC